VFWAEKKGESITMGAPNQEVRRELRNRQNNDGILVEDCSNQKGGKRRGSLLHAARVNLYLYWEKEK